MGHRGADLRRRRWDRQTRRWHELFTLLLDGCRAEDLAVSLAEMQAPGLLAWIDAQRDSIQRDTLVSLPEAA